MNVRGRHTSVKLDDDIVLTIGVRKKIKFKYRFKINNASYLTITNDSLDGAERIAKRSAKRSKENLGTIQLISITKIL